MSWSFDSHGTPDQVCEEIDNSPNNNLGEPSLGEWNGSKEALKTLVKENQGRMIQVSANGHAVFQDGMRNASTVNVIIKGFTG